MKLVEPIVGLLGVGTAGDHAIAKTGVDYFNIGGLGFKIAAMDTSNAGSAYIRTTAQFRKDQLDTSSTYGDQSLVGYWTRGQFSFHQGSGVKYYEVSEGDTVLNRFDRSLGVDPSKPGQVTLLSELQLYSELATFGDVRWVGVGTAGTMVLDGTTLKYGAALTSAFTPTSGTVTHACIGGQYGYVTTTDDKIEQVDLTAGTATVLYTHSAGFDGLFWAKDRLWAVSEGAWYQLAAAPGSPPVTLASTDIAFTASPSTDKWSLADSPGAVLMARGNQVFAVTISNTGDVPTLSGPIQVAGLPAGESIYDIGYYLGFLILRTTRGVRVASVSSNGQVTYGPLLVDAVGFNDNTASITGSGSWAMVAHAGTVWAIDLSEQIGSGLEFSTFALYELASGAEAVGVAGPLFWNSTQVLFGGSGIGDATGYLYTGLHRYATIENKKFLTVKVLAEGASGTIAVTRVSADGSELDLYTIDVSVEKSVEIDLLADSPIPALGLKFTLTEVGGVGPTLLGYQLKALPAPKRQRLIQVPLSCFDNERKQPNMSSGHRGSAWSRLAALEAMEESGGTFQFRDFRTGEAGECFVESVEFHNTTPPSATSSGFGGYLVLTIRKL